MSIGKVSVFRPFSAPKEASLETSRLESRPTPPSAKAEQSSFQAGPVGRPLVDLQGGLGQTSKVEAAKVEGVAELQQELAVYGISLKGDWSVEELKLLLGTVQGMDERLRNLMEAQGETGFSEGELFQQLFGQATFERVDAANLGQGKLAEQQNYDPATGTSTIRVSDGAFTVTRGNGRPLTPEQLIAHELSHIINKRFLTSDGQAFGATDLVPPPSGTLGFSARTNTTGPEWVADVFANYLMGTLQQGDVEYAGQVRDIALYLLSDDANKQ